MSDSTICTTAPGKLILLGEYAVLEQAPCLVAAVDRNCSVKIDPFDGDTFRIEASNPNIPDLQFIINDNGDLSFKSELTSTDRERLRFVIATLKYVIERYSEQLNGAAIRINTDSFYHVKTGHKLGLGASAAITVSLLAALMEHIGEPQSRTDIYREAYPVHRSAQGKLGSGSDIAASAKGGIIEYRMPENDHKMSGAIELLKWPQNLQMIPIWAGCSASTQDMVRRVQDYRNEEPTIYNAIMNPMIKLSEEGCNAFRAGDIEGFLNIVSAFARQEKKLGEASQTDIISEAHEEITDIVENAGGVYKPSGAGSGDVGVAFCGEKDMRFKIEDALEDSSFDMLDISLQSKKMKIVESNEVG